jgi:diketogulonate reductase-like aldo/keto reductase
LAKVKREGLTRYIGVSNFTVALIEQAVALTTEPLVCDQIEYHSFLDQSKVIAACREHDMAVVAYSPIARGKASGDRVLARIAAAHNKTAAQVSLRFLVQQNIVVIPRTSKTDRLLEKAAIFDFALSPREMTEIAALARPDGRIIDWSYSGRANWD